MRPFLLILPLLALPLSLAAVPLAAEPGLPDEPAVLEALTQHPSVAAARAQVDAARADARARVTGPHEVTLAGSYTRRTAELEGDFDEFDVSVTRAFRLPGKQRLDRQIGVYGVEEAENLAEDARHQAALGLMERWFDWLGASAAAEVDLQAVANYERALAAGRRRIELHDAAQRDADQAEAVLAGAQTLAEQSTSRALVARSRLEAHFPALALPAAAPQLPAPELPASGLERLRELLLANSHEIAAADAFAARMASTASQASRERVADPSLGVRLFSERNGEERGAGLLFSIPLGGGYRSALADSAAAQANAAAAQAALARYNVRETADSDLAEADYRQSAWQRSREGVAAQLAALADLRRGHELGEVELAELLLGESMVQDAVRSEIDARTEALRAITRLRIDSHELWLRD